MVNRRGGLSRPDAEALVSALVLLAQVLAPFAPHIAEELLLAAGRADGPELVGSWPQEAAIAEAAAPTGA